MLGPAAHGIAPPPFLQPKKEPEEDPEEKRRKLWEKAPVIVDDTAGEHKSTSKAWAGILLAFLGTTVICMGVGWMAGGQIFRTVRGTRAIDSAAALYKTVEGEREMLRDLKSRVSGAARRALNPTEPAADFELLNYLAKISKERPFQAKAWTQEHYQYFKCAPLVFGYHSSSSSLWNLIDAMAQRYANPDVQNALKNWPQKRAEVLKLVSTDEKSGYAALFRDEGGKVVAVLGTFHEAERVTEGGKGYTKAKVRPLGGEEEKVLIEYEPSSGAPLSDNPGNWFIRLNPETLVGPQRLIVHDPGPLLAREQDAYRQYLTDLNQLSLALQNTQGDQEKLMGALGEIKQAPRPFTFGF